MILVISTMKVRALRVPDGMDQATFCEVVETKTGKKCFQTTTMWVFEIQNGTNEDMEKLEAIPGFTVERIHEKPA